MKRDASGPIVLPNGLIDAVVLADPVACGYLMADTVRHAAKAYAAARRLGKSEASQAIVEGLGGQSREQFNTVTSIKGSN